MQLLSYVFQKEKKNIITNELINREQKKVKIKNLYRGLKTRQTTKTFFFCVSTFFSLSYYILIVV